MNKLKVWFTNIWPQFEDENIFLSILQKHFDVEVTYNEPNVVIHSVFGGVEDAQKFKCKKILFIGENYRASSYPHDYAVSFDPHTETNFRLPLWQFYLILRPELKDILFSSRPNNDKFDRGGAFVVSNPANFFRNGFYNKFRNENWISWYSYGRYLTNNFELQKESQGRYWRDAKYDFFIRNKHKYFICFEHSAYPYYCTEKLMDAYLAGALPLYWGDPKVNEDWNKDAFINVGRIGQDAAYELVKKMQQDNDLFLQMYTQPIFTEEQKERHLKNISNFEDWLIKIVNK